MALIKCPECSKEVSDKAETCIHCGYPIRCKPYIHEVINGVDIDLTFLLDTSIGEIIKMHTIREKTGCDIVTAKSIVQKYSPSVSKPQSKPTEKPLTCPQCGSTDITSGTRGFTLMTGFLGSGNHRNVCKRCGFKWKPGSLLETINRDLHGHR